MKSNQPPEKNSDVSPKADLSFESILKAFQEVKDEMVSAYNKLVAESSVRGDPAQFLLEKITEITDGQSLEAINNNFKTNWPKKQSFFGSREEKKLAEEFKHLLRILNWIEDYELIVSGLIRLKQNTSEKLQTAIAADEEKRREILDSTRGIQAHYEVELRQDAVQLIDNATRAHEEAVNDTLDLKKREVQAKRAIMDLEIKRLQGKIRAYEDKLDKLKEKINADTQNFEQRKIDLLRASATIKQKNIQETTELEIAINAYLSDLSKTRTNYREEIVLLKQEREAIVTDVSSSKVSKEVIANINAIQLPSLSEAERIDGNSFWKLEGVAEKIQKFQRILIQRHDELTEAQEKITTVVNNSADVLSERLRTLSRDLAVLDKTLVGEKASGTDEWNRKLNSSIDKVADVYSDSTMRLWSNEVKAVIKPPQKPNLYQLMQERGQEVEVQQSAMIADLTSLVESFQKDTIDSFNRVIEKAASEIKTNAQKSLKEAKANTVKEIQDADLRIAKTEEVEAKLSVFNELKKVKLEGVVFDTALQAKLTDHVESIRKEAQKIAGKERSLKEKISSIKKAMPLLFAQINPYVNLTDVPVTQDPVTVELRAKYVNEDAERKAKFASYTITLSQSETDLGNILRDFDENKINLSQIEVKLQKLEEIEKNLNQLQEQVKPFSRDVKSADEQRKKEADEIREKQRAAELVRQVRDVSGGGEEKRPPEPPQEKEIEEIEQPEKPEESLAQQKKTGFWSRHSENIITAMGSGALFGATAGAAVGFVAGSVFAPITFGLSVPVFTTASAAAFALVGGAVGFVGSVVRALLADYRQAKTEAKPIEKREFKIVAMTEEQEDFQSKKRQKTQKELQKKQVKEPAPAMVNYHEHALPVEKPHVTNISLFNHAPEIKNRIVKLENIVSEKLKSSPQDTFFLEEQVWLEQINKENNQEKQEKLLARLEKEIKEQINKSKPASEPEQKH